MTTSCCFTFTTTVRVIDRVHDHTANGRTNTAPAHRASFTDFTQAVLGITDFTNRCTALDVHATYFTRAQTHLSVGTFTCHQHNASASGTCHLGTFTWQHFDAMHHGTDWDVTDWQAVTRFDRCFRTVHHAVANGHAFGCDDVVTFAVGVAQQSDIRGAVWIVFDTFHFR